MVTYSGSTSLAGVALPLFIWTVASFVSTGINRFETATLLANVIGEKNDITCCDKVTMLIQPSQCEANANLKLLKSLPENYLCKQILQSKFYCKKNPCRFNSHKDVPIIMHLGLISKMP